MVLPGGRTLDLAGDVWFPNGMALVDDGRTLVVAESHADRLTAFTIEESGDGGVDLVDRRVWADLGPGAAPDGICADADGAIWYASVPQQWCRRVAEGGEVLDTVPTGQPAFSCVLGGADGRTLHVVTNDYGPEGASNGRVLTTVVEVPRTRACPS